MIQQQHRLSVRSDGQGLTDITGEVAHWLAGQAITEGQHTSASLVIQENADPAVLEDLAAYFKRLVPEDPRLYRHSAEGPDDMPAHIKSALTQSQLAIPVAGGRLALGTWQGIYLFEHRRRPHRREIVLHLIGQ
jgi:secondary thiamine-phosphate synthase enzyme